MVPRQMAKFQKKLNSRFQIEDGQASRPTTADTTRGHDGVTQHIYYIDHRDLWIINIDGMTKPVITLGIAGGTGAGKVRLHFKRKQLVAYPYAPSPYTRFHPCTFIGSPPLQNLCTKHLEVTRMLRTSFMTATIRVRRRVAKEEAARFLRGQVSHKNWPSLYIIQTRLTKHWRNELRRILIIRIVLTRHYLYNTLGNSRKDCRWRYLPMILKHTLEQRLRKNALRERLFWSKVFSSLRNPSLSRS